MKGKCLCVCVCVCVFVCLHACNSSRVFHRLLAFVVGKILAYTTCEIGTCSTKKHELDHLTRHVLCGVPCDVRVRVCVCVCVCVLPVQRA